MSSTTSFISSPPELIDTILSFIPATSDLLSVSLTCKALHAQAYPHHIEYRVLNARGPAPVTWAHLARRTDRARHIHTVHIQDSPYGATPLNLINDVNTPSLSPQLRVPTTLIEPEDRDPLKCNDEVRLENMCAALSSMRNLVEFTWVRLPPSERDRIRMWGTRAKPVVDPQEDEVFWVLSQLPQLRMLTLVGHFSLHNRQQALDGQTGSEEGREMVESPLWKLSNLQSLKLGGFRWSQLLDDVRLKNLFASDSLQTLDLPIDPAHLFTTNIQFPTLNSLFLTSLPSAAASIAALHPNLAFGNVQVGNNAQGQGALATTRGQFFAAHPQIHSLSWYHAAPIYLPAGALPGLKRLRAQAEFLLALDDQTTRPIECLALKRVDWDVVKKMCGNHASKTRQRVGQDEKEEEGFMKRDALKKLVIEDVERIDMLEKIGKCVGKNVTLLSAERVLKGAVGVPMLLQTLAAFPSLQDLRTELLYPAFDSISCPLSCNSSLPAANPSVVNFCDDIVQQLARACPNLTRLEVRERCGMNARYIEIQRRRDMDTTTVDVKEDRIRLVDWTMTKIPRRALWHDPPQFYKA